MYYAAQMFALDSNCTNKALLARAKGNYVCCVHGNARHTTDYVCALSRGEFYLVYGQYDKAIAAFNEAITFYPDESYPKEMIKACEMEKARKK